MRIINRIRHRLILERPVLTQDETGGDSYPDFEYYDEVWAGIEPIKGREFLRGDQIQSELDTIVIIRWSPHVDIVNAKWRFRHVPAARNETIYNIAGQPAHVRMGHREIHFSCKSGMNPG